MLADQTKPKSLTHAANRAHRALMGPILLKKSLILMKNNKIANKNIKDVKSLKNNISVVLR